MKDLKEYINESTGITANKLKELALEKADKGKDDGWIYFKKPIVIGNSKFVAISDDGKYVSFIQDFKIQVATSFLSDSILTELYNELKKL